MGAGRALVGLDLPNNLDFAWAGPVLPGAVRSAGQYGARLYLSIPSSECVGIVSMHEYASYLRIDASFGAKVSTHFITTAA